MGQILNHVDPYRLQLTIFLDTTTKSVLLEVILIKFKMYRIESIIFIKHSLTVTKFRSSLPEVFLGKGVLKICSKLTGEHPCRSVISIKLLCFVHSNTLNRNKVLWVVYSVRNNAIVQLNNVTCNQHNLMKHFVYVKSNSTTLSNNMITGNNNFYQGFHVLSFNLRTDIILLQYNKLNHLIYAIDSNVNVNSIAARENIINLLTTNVPII